jgi:pyruvate ferredoxin oxidoreductase gamma subunit/2-oxoisovalerate ferredoxin oxidoreductase gamma subunit
MREIKFFGRGGQGAVTAAQILATAAFLEGRQSQTFPQFGAERRGAPVLAFVRINDEPITIRSKIYEPDVVIVMDSNLFKMVSPLDGLKPDGTAILNADESEAPAHTEVPGLPKSVYTIDASAISYEVYGRTAIPITNIIFLGAYCAAVADVSLESVEEALPRFLPAGKIEMNTRAAWLGFQSVREA